jgi:hypothetical protein
MCHCVDASWGSRAVDLIPAHIWFSWRCFRFSLSVSKSSIKSLGVTHSDKGDESRIDQVGFTILQEMLQADWILAQLF